MSLKIEQRLINQQFTEFQPRIYTTGVYLVPMKVNLKGIEKWIWVADEFADDTYNDKGEISPTFVIADSVEELFKNDE